MARQRHAQITRAGFAAVAAVFAFVLLPAAAAAAPISAKGQRHPPRQTRLADLLRILHPRLRPGQFPQGGLPIQTGPRRSCGVQGRERERGQDVSG